MVSFDVVLRLHGLLGFLGVGIRPVGICAQFLHQKVLEVVFWARDQILDQLDLMELDVELMDVAVRELLE